MSKGIRALIMLATLCCVMLAPPLSAKDAAVAQSGLRLVGQGQMNWMFFDLYQAHFYSADGHYQEGQTPLALTLRYQKKISRDALIDATITEWQRLNIQMAPSWITQLTRFWPSVKKGDELAIRVDGAGSSRFYFNQIPIGDIEDPAFGPAFLAIWLSSNSRNPKLTQQLKGN